MGLSSRVTTINEKRRYHELMTLLSTLQRWWLPTSTASLQKLTDAELLSDFQQHEESLCLEILIERHNDALFHFIKSLSDAGLAEDLCQQVWLKLLEQPRSFQPGQAQFKTWLFTVARNALVDELRRQQRWQWSDLDTIDEQPDMDWQSELLFSHHKNLEQQFHQALTTMPFIQREALMLQLDGFSVQEISDITAEKAETIKSRLRFARKFLKQTLEVTDETR